MDQAIRFIMKQDKRLLLATVVLVILIMVAIWKMATALTGSEVEAPEFKSEVTRAFVTPASDSLVEAQYLTKLRLPDDDYREVIKSGQKLVPKIADLSVTTEELREAGASGTEMRSSLSSIQLYRDSLRGRTVGFDKNLKLSGATISGDSMSVVLTTPVQYGAKSDGSPGIQGTISLSYANYANDGWNLDSASLAVSDGGA